MFLSIVNRAPGTDPPLVARIGEQDLGAISRVTRAVEQKRTEQFELFWHRLPVPNALVERAEVLNVEVFPNPDALFSPGVVGLVGGYSYRPSAPPAPSAFFDGFAWSADPVTVLPGEGHPAGFTGPVRYHVELRVFAPDTRRYLYLLY
ncbi:MAG: hypothetical protein ACR2NO_01780 [Chloroflexota bacterium]